jgi:hypothetical protein
VSDARSRVNKRKFGDADLEKDTFGSDGNNNNTPWQQAPGSELMGADLSDLMRFDIL